MPYIYCIVIIIIFNKCSPDRCKKSYQPLTFKQKCNSCTHIRLYQIDLQKKNVHWCSEKIKISARKDGKEMKSKRQSKQKTNAGCARTALNSSLNILRSEAACACDLQTSIFNQSVGVDWPQWHGQSHQWCCNPLDLAFSPGTQTNTHTRSHTPRSGRDGRGGKGRWRPRQQFKDKQQKVKTSVWLNDRASLKIKKEKEIQS